MCLQGCGRAAESNTSLTNRHCIPEFSAVQDGIVAHLCHLLLEASGTLSQQTAILDLLTSLTVAHDSTSCMDLYDESAVPRLVIILAQPGCTLLRTPETSGYVNSVAEGETAPPPTTEEGEVQEAAAALLVAACMRNPQCLDQVCYLVRCSEIPDVL